MQPVRTPASSRVARAESGEPDSQIPGAACGSNWRSAASRLRTSSCGHSTTRTSRQRPVPTSTAVSVVRTRPPARSRDPGAVAARTAGAPRWIRGDGAVQPALLRNRSRLRSTGAAASAAAPFGSRKARPVGAGVRGGPGEGGAPGGGGSRGRAAGRPRADDGSTSSTSPTTSAIRAASPHGRSADRRAKVGATAGRTRSACCAGTGAGVATRLAASGPGGGAAATAPVPPAPSAGSRRTPTCPSSDIGSR